MPIEYSKQTVGQNPCTYSHLRNMSGTPVLGPQSGMSYNTCEKAPGAPDTRLFSNFNAGIYTVPLLCQNNDAYPDYPPKYDTLSHGSNYLCGGYFDMQKAYPRANCSSCDAPYTQRSCAGNIQEQCKQSSGIGASMARKGWF
jgi:hypothetical protein